MFTVDASRLRNELFKRGLSATEFAKLVGINALTMARLLKGGARTQAKVIAAIAKFLGIAGDELILKE